MTMVVSRPQMAAQTSLNRRGSDASKGDFSPPFLWTEDTLLSPWSELNALKKKIGRNDK